MRSLAAVRILCVGREIDPIRNVMTLNGRALKP